MNLTDFVTDNIQSAWRHFRDNIKTYIIGKDIVLFTYDLDENAVTHIHILHFEIKNVSTLHELIKTIIDEMPIDLPSCNLSTYNTLGSITLRNIGNHLNEYELDHFCYKGYRFVKNGENGVLHVTNPEYIEETTEV